MAYEIRDNTGRRRYEFYVDGELAGELAYRRSPEATRLIHTEIYQQYEGHGLGSIFAQAVLDSLRASGESVVPQCEFVAKFIQEHPDYADMVVESD
jgi:predicted GNAT family acetyltransferase